jgi:2-C-methyl-D-erythritol 4-phosphate cytidylyltransferase
VRYYLVIPAAGSGRRFAAVTPKQYAPLAGATVIEHALAPFEADADCLGLVIALAPDDPHWDAVAARRRRPVVRAQGGAERALSVRSGLAALGASARDDDWVMVHDAARPCLTTPDLLRLKQSLEGDPTGGLLAVPLADTLKRAIDIDAENAQVDGTIDRAGLWRAATPQCFRLGTLTRALDGAIAAGRVPTDEAQAVEWAGGRPRLIPCRADNIKVTTSEDLVLAAAILATRSTEQH